jgi:hypothetical protein
MIGIEGNLVTQDSANFVCMPTQVSTSHTGPSYKRVIPYADQRAYNCTAFRPERWRIDFGTHLATASPAMPTSHRRYKVKYCDDPSHPARPHRHPQRVPQNWTSPPAPLEKYVRELSALFRRSFNEVWHWLRSGQIALLTQIQIYCWKSGLPLKDVVSLTLALILLISMAVSFSPKGTTILTSDTLALQAETFPPELEAALREVFDTERATQIKFQTQHLVGGKPTHYFWLPEEGLGLVWTDGAATWIPCLDLDDLVRRWGSRTDGSGSGSQ